MILGFGVDEVMVIENPSFEGWRLKYTINDEIGVFKSDYGEVKRFSRKEVGRLISENNREWARYWKENSRR